MWMGLTDMRIRAFVLFLTATVVSLSVMGCMAAIPLAAVGAYGGVKSRSAADAAKGETNQQGRLRYAKLVYADRTIWTCSADGLLNCSTCVPIKRCG
jgi:hypothetical protein